MARELPSPSDRAKFVTGIVCASVAMVALGVLVVLDSGTGPDSRQSASADAEPNKSRSAKKSRGRKNIKPAVRTTKNRASKAKSRKTVRRLSLSPHPFGRAFEKINGVSERKKAFIEAILPIVREENKRILRQRRAASKRPTAKLSKLYKRYRVKEGNRKTLLRRIDAIPPSLAVAQAAIESGWGGSRFMREANNVYGERTYKKGADGIVPREATDFKITKFRSVRASVRSYMHNLNSNRAYLAFRAARAAARNKSAVPDGLALATYLTRYSELRKTYVETVQQVIRDNDLKKLDGRQFAKN